MSSSGSPLVPSLALRFEEKAPKRLQRRGSAKHSWTTEEDEALYRAVQKYGLGQWSLVSRELGSQRNSKQCRERYTNHLSPAVNNEAWTTEEDELILLLRTHIGNKWTTMASVLPGRSSNGIKNRYNSTLRRKIGRGEFDYLVLSYEHALRRIPQLHELQAAQESPRKRQRAELSADEDDECGCESSSSSSSCAASEICEISPRDEVPALLARMKAQVDAAALANETSSRSISSLASVLMHDDDADHDHDTQRTALLAAATAASPSSAPPPPPLKRSRTDPQLRVVIPPTMQQQWMLPAPPTSTPTSTASSKARNIVAVVTAKSGAACMPLRQYWNAGPAARPLSMSSRLLLADVSPLRQQTMVVDAVPLTTTTTTTTTATTSATTTAPMAMATPMSAALASVFDVETMLATTTLGGDAAMMAAAAASVDAPSVDLVYAAQPSSSASPSEALAWNWPFACVDSPCSSSSQ